MASPLTYYMLPTQLKTDCGEDEFSGAVNLDDLHVARKYTLTIPDEAFPGHTFPTDASYVQGIMSPIVNVTLPPHCRCVRQQGS